MTRTPRTTSTDNERFRAVLERCRDILATNHEIEVTEADPPLDVDGRVVIGTALVKYTVGGLAVTIDFELLTRVMLKLADGVFASFFDVTFQRDGTLDSAVNHKVADAIRTIDGAAVVTLADYFTELVFQGVASAAESFAKEMFDRPLTLQEQKPIREIARATASELLATRLPSVGRGGDTRSDSGPSDEDLVRFYRTAERVYPFWQDVHQRATRDDDGWRADAQRLPEYRRFSKAERRHADVVIGKLQSGRKLNGARPTPRSLAREHARAIAGLAEASESKLRKLASRGQKLAESDAD